MHSTAPVMISSPRQAPCGAAASPDASAANTPSTAMPTPIDLAQRQRLDAEQRADHHGLQRQGRQREAGARRGRVADRDIVEDEEQPEEAKAEGGDGRPIARAAAICTRSSTATGSTQRKPMPQRRMASVIGSALPTR